MDYKSHFGIGLLITIILGGIFIYFGKIDFSWSNIALLFFISLIFSLLPDLDIGTSMIRKFFMVFFGLFMIYAFWTGNIGFDLGSIPYMSYLKDTFGFSWFQIIGILGGIFLVLLQFLRHRGIMHGWIIGIIISGLLYLYFLDWPYCVIALANFISHLIVDD